MRRDGTALPALVVLMAAIATCAVVLPLAAILVNVPWGQAVELLTATSSLTALRLSLVTSTISALVCLLLALPLALVLTRTRLPGRSLLRAVVLVPLVLPPVVSGLALLMTVGRRGLFGPLLEAVDVRIVFTTTAVVLAQVFVSLPFTVLTLESALVTAGSEPERLAATLGAGPLTVLRRITLPRLAPAILTGTILAFARSLGEFGATLTVAGSLEGTTRTLPLQIYLARESDTGSAAVLSLLLIIVALGVVLLAYARRSPRAGAAPARAGTR
ncbi:ABC transporter permease [Brachybacterium huguangmaarense]|uniref:Molybdenum transport system permease n=1 Tax=Brachybacterium huguangmaarense TaxID=1652028 RepID=A0ABY6G1S7_9MICO|nr:ABC transporter permease [Brachybacterium huguangmaarense]UYG16633.1 ABC transporter permease [Brachybacterium huguangmaarense]